MKQFCWILPFAFAASLCAAPKTNSSDADTNAPTAEKKTEAAAIPTPRTSRSSRPTP